MTHPGLDELRRLERARARLGAAVGEILELLRTDFDLPVERDGVAAAARELTEQVRNAHAAAKREVGL